jgi:hypothetical protein
MLTTDSLDSKDRSQVQARFMMNSIVYNSLFQGMERYVNDLAGFLSQMAVDMREMEPPHFENEVSELEYSMIIDQYENDLPTLFIDSYIIILVTTLERELMTYCKTISSANNIEIKLNEFRGGFYEQFKIFLTKVAKFDYDFDSDQWENIVSLVEVRNTIVHNNSIIDDNRRGNIIRKFSESNPELKILNQRLYPTFNFCDDMTQLVLKFLEYLSKIASDHFK